MLLHSCTAAESVSDVAEQKAMGCSRWSAHICLRQMCLPAPVGALQMCLPAIHYN